MNIFFKNAEKADITESDWKLERLSGIFMVVIGTLLGFAKTDLFASPAAFCGFMLLVGFQQIWAAWFLRRFVRMEKMIREIQATVSRIGPKDEGPCTDDASPAPEEFLTKLSKEAIQADRLNKDQSCTGRLAAAIIGLPRSLK